MIKVPSWRVSVGPIEEAELNSGRYSHIINVSDHPGPGFGLPNNYWYPINEMSNWGYGVFYWSKKILDNILWTPESKILIHCDGGICRSPSILMGYLYSRGLSRKEIEKLLIDKWPTKKFSDLQEQNCIPQDLTVFYKYMNFYPSFSLMGILSLMDHRMEH